MNPSFYSSQSQNNVGYKVFFIIRSDEISSMNGRIPSWYALAKHYEDSLGSTLIICLIAYVTDF